MSASPPPPSLRIRQELREEDEAALLDVLGFLAAEVPTGRSFELVQAVLAVFLRVHAEALAGSARLRERAEPLREDLRRGWGKLDALLQDVRCAAGLLAGAAAGGGGAVVPGL